MFKGTINLDMMARAQALSAPGCMPSGLDIAVLRHPMLEDFQWMAAGRVILLCREQCRDSSPLPPPPREDEVDHAAVFCRSHSAWPLDHQCIDIDLRAKTVCVTAGHGGVAPLYLHHAAGRLTISWSLVNLYPLISLDDVLPDAVALLMTGTPPYAAATMFRSVHMLTERATLRVTPAGVTIEYPPPAPYYVPTQLRADADVIGAACDLVASLLRRWPAVPARHGAEFSGGLDSAVVAATLAGLQSSPLPTYALQVAGPARVQQTDRRQAAIERFGFEDRLFDVSRVPAIPASFDPRFSYHAAPYNADLQQSLRLLLPDYVRHTGVQVIATGTGGDELLMPHAFEQAPEQFAQNANDGFLPAELPSSMRGRNRTELAEYAAHCDRAPFPVVPISVLEASAARGPLFIEHGLWPVTPFAQPEAIRFYRCLPPEWRAKKHLHTMMLHRLGFPDGFMAATQRENFVVYLTASVAAAVPAIAHSLRRSCHLHELGLVDANGLIRQFESVTTATPLEDLGYLLHCFNMEHILCRLGTN